MENTTSVGADLLARIVLNRSAGVFSLSELARNELLARKGNVVDLQILQMTTAYRQKHRSFQISSDLFIDRADPDLVSIVEEMGPLADGPGAELTIVTIPGNTDWTIRDVCGIEFICAGGQVWPPAPGAMSPSTAE